MRIFILQNILVGKLKMTSQQKICRLGKIHGLSGFNLLIFTQNQYS